MTAMTQIGSFDLVFARLDTADRCLDHLGQQLLEITTAPSVRRETLQHTSDYARTVMKFIKGIRESFDMRREVSAAKNHAEAMLRQKKRAEERRQKHQEETLADGKNENKSDESFMPQDLQKARNSLDRMKKNLPKQRP